MSLMVEGVGMKTNLNANKMSIFVTGFPVWSIEKFMACTFAEVMTYVCMSVRLVDGCVVVRLTLLSTRRDGSWEVESSRFCRLNAARMSMNYD